MITLTTEQAQQIEEALLRVEQNAEECMGDDGMVMVVPLDLYNELTEALSIIRAARAQEQAEQEPVAEVVLRSHKVGFGRTEERKDIVFLADVEVGTNLYAAPVRTKDLTDDEISKLRHKIDWTAEWSYVNFARAVIAADREKNK